MKKTFTTFKFLLICLISISFSYSSFADNIVIIGANADTSNDIAFVATAAIPAGTIFYFTDKEWDGTGFTTGEGTMEYAVPASGLAIGTVVTLSPSGASIGTVTSTTGNYNLAVANDPVYAYMGTNAATPTAICSVFSDVALSASENPTGDSEAPNVVVVGPLASDQDNAEYTGARSFPSIAALIAALTDPANYTQTDGTGDQSIAFNTTPFTIGLSFEALVDCDDNVGTDAAFGEMYVHISNIVNADVANPITFTSSTGTVVGTIAAAATTGTIQITGLTTADFGTLITLMADNNGTILTIEIPVPICGFSVDTGGDGNMEDDVSNGTFCTSQNGVTAPGILTQVIGGSNILSGNNITSSYTYVLVDNTNGDAIAATNMTGIFDASDGVSNMNDYTVYAFYVSDAEQGIFDTAAAGITSISTGDDILTGMGAFANICYNFCCSAMYAPNCCTADAGDLTTSTTTSDFIICEGLDLLDDAMASAAFANVYTETDETDPNVNDPADYETAYITADAAGNILEFNTTGDFDFSNDAIYTGGNTYSIYLLNYKIDNTPNTAAAYLAALSPSTIAQIVSDDSDMSSGGAGTGSFCLDISGLDLTGTQVTVMILPEPVVIAQTGMTCSDVASGITLGASTNSTAADTYNITILNLNGLTASAGIPAVANGVTNAEINDDAYTNTTGADVDVVYTIVPVSADGCEGDPFTVTLTVKSEPVVIAQTGMICSDVASGITLGASMNATAAATYNITILNLNGLTASAGSPAIGNALTDSEIVDDAYTNTTGADVDVIYTVVPVSADGCEGDPFTVTLTVKPEPVVIAQTGMTCSDVASGITLGASTNATAVATYNITILNLNGLTASAGSPATGNALTDSEIVDDAYTNTTGADVDVIYTIVPVSADGCEGEAFTVTLTVKSEPVGSDPTPALCSNTALNVDLQAQITNGQTGVTFSWTSVDNPDVDGETPSSIATSITDDLTNTSGTMQTVVYTVTPTSSVADGECEGEPFTVTVTLDSEPVVAAQTTAVCSDVANGITLGASTNATAAATYNVINFDINGLTFSAGSINIANGLADDEIVDHAFTNTTSADVDVTYTIVPVSATGCLGDPFTVVLTVQPEPVVVNQTGMICSDVVSGITLGASTNGTAAATYNITGVNVPASLTGTGTSGNGLADNAIAGDTYTNTTGADVDVIYTVVPVSADGCEGDPFTVTLTVKSEPVGSDPTPALCSNTVLNVDLQTQITNGQTGVTFSWTSVDNPDVDGETASSTATSITDDLTNTSGTMQTVVYTVTPTSSVADGECEGEPFTVTVTLDSEPVVAAQTTAVCSGSATVVTLGASTNATAVANYNITNVDVAAGLTGAGTSGNGLADNAIVGDVFTNPTTGSLDVVYTIVPVSAGSCEGDPFTVTVTIDPMVNVDLSTIVTDICYKAATDLIDLSGDYISGATNAGTWTTSGDGTFNDASNLHPTVTAYTTGSSDRSQATVTLTLTADPGNTCPIDSDNITVTIKDVTCTNNSFFGGNN